jgi:hypothetical protein
MTNIQSPMRYDNDLFNNVSLAVLFGSNGKSSSLFSDVYIQGKDKIMETLDNIGIKLFVLAALKEH